MNASIFVFTNSEYQIIFVIEAENPSLLKTNVLYLEILSSRQKVRMFLFVGERLDNSF